MFKKLLMTSFLFGFICASSALAQTGSVTGVVTNAENGEPLPGTNVILVEITRGGATDVDGRYNIQSVPEGTYTLRVNFVGFQTYETQVQVGSDEVTVDIALQEEVFEFDDVIVTAYGITRDKRAVAYQTQEVSSEDLLSGQASSAAEGLVGKVAGLQINVQDNGVKSNSQIILRGLRSISGNNEALVVIDGSIASTGAFRDLNPNDIENINVLKGATAAALYGSDASNGVLVVTTKRGEKNARFTVGYDHSSTFEQVAYMPDFQTEYGIGWDGDYLQFENTNWGPRYDGQVRQVGFTLPEGYILETQRLPYSPIKDNLKDFYETGQNVQNTIYISGGDETGSFYMSVGNNNVSGLIPDDTYEKYTFTANGTKQLGDITLGVNASYMQDDKDVVGNSIGDQNRTLYWFVLNTPSNIPLTDYKDWDNPASYGYADNYFNAFYQNPYWAIGTNRDTDETKRLRGNINASWDILENLNLSGQLGVNSIAGTGKNWRAAQDYTPSLQPYHTPVSAFVTDSEFQNSTVTGDLILTGDFQLNEDFGLRAIVGTATKMIDSRSSSLRANNLSIPGFYDISNGTGELVGSVSESQRRSYGFFGDLEFNFQQWAYLNVTGRQDYTSTLPASDNSYFYPGGGVSVILNEAIPSLANNEVISLIKLTGNYSTVYRDLNPYQVNERYSQSGSFPFGTINGFFLSATAVDESIKKEKLNTTEFGLNTAFLRGRVNFDAAYYMTSTSNLITTITPSDASGSTGYLTNIGELSGQGVELQLGGSIINNRDFIWDVNLNYTSYEQVVDEIQPGVSEIAIESYTAGYGTYAIKDEVFPQIKAVSYQRDDQGRVIVDAVDGRPLVGELEAQGKTTPDYVLGLNTAVRFKGFTVSTTMDYRTGHVYYAQGQDAMEFTGRSMESIAGDRQNFVWPNSVYQSGTSNGAPVYTENTNIPISGGVMTFWQNRYNEIKENYVKDATAFKIRELSVKYDVPSRMLNRTNVIRKLQVGFIARNLLTLLPEGQTKFSDPEFRNTGGSYADNGIGVGGYLTAPPTRSYGFSVKVEF